MLPVSVLLAFLIQGTPGPVVLDDFERLAGWSAAPSDGVRLEVRADSGRTGRAMRLDFDFQGRGGYAVARKALRLELPENYVLSFWIRGDAPDNNLEFKLVDSTGTNVWWRNLRGFSFPRQWRKVTIRRRHVEFAWGPAGGGEPAGITAIELAITAGNGGKGSVWIDDFQLEPRPPDLPYDLTPTVTASGARPGFAAARLADGDSLTGWKARAGGRQWVSFDFLRPREYGGLVIEWESAPRSYLVETSDDGRRWTTAYRALATNGGRDDLRLPESESRYLRVVTSGPRAPAITRLTVQALGYGATTNSFLHAVARAAPRGRWPRYLDSVQSWWTMTGENGDGRRSLLGQDGAFEPLAGGFSVEPFLFMDGSLHTWADARATLSLAMGYLPIPTVERVNGPVALSVTAVSSGRGDTASSFTRYRLINRGSARTSGTLYLAIRPLQVNPPWQFLGVPGGAAPVTSLAWDGRRVAVNGVPRIVPSGAPAGFGASTWDRGEIGEYLARGVLPLARAASDSAGLASGALAWRFTLAPGESTAVVLRFPLADSPPASALRPADKAPFDLAAARWDSLLSMVTIELPPEAEAVERALRSTLAYILINRDGSAIEPGARSYRRAWIRDGAMIGNALLRLGHPEPVREFIEWYAPYQYETGKVPCCVDHRGSDPVPEHDSHGELIHIIAEYYRYTGDREFLGRMWPHIEGAARYIDSLRSTRRTAEYTSGANRRYFGLMPPSISHEGYSARPVHSYWDDFWVLRGLADAVDMAAVLGREGDLAWLRPLHREFRHDLHGSVRRTMAEAGIAYIPGSADLADYDPTSTTVGLEPAGQLDSLPAEALRHTFDRYLREITRRSDSAGWDAYTPYEWRNVGAFVRMGEPGKAWAVFEILFDGRRPAEWNQWPEVVHRDTLAPRFLGDLPHTWVGSDFARSLLDMIAYVRHGDSALVIGAGLPASWVESGDGVTIRGLPVGRGRIDIRLNRGGYELHGSLAVPPGGILVRRPGGGRFVRVVELPAEGRW